MAVVMGCVMKSSVLITDTTTDFGRELAVVFAREGWEVFFPKDFARIKKLDVLADTTDFWCDDGDYEKIFRESVIKPMETLEKFLPLLDAGEGKRLFYLSSRTAMINENVTCDAYVYDVEGYGADDAAGFAFKMSKAALHQFLQMVHNRLYPQGYALRLFERLEGRVPDEHAAESAFLYITRRRGTENHDPTRDDESALVLRDAEGRTYCW